MEDENDEREAQVLKDFDALYEELADAIDRYSLPPPPLFQRDATHTCLTSFNESQAEKDAALENIEEERMRAASSLIEHLVETGRLSVMSRKKFRGSDGKETPFPIIQSEQNS